MSLRRSIWLLVAAVVVQLFALTAQISEDSGEATPLERWGVALVSPFAAAVDWTGDALAGVGDGLATRSDLFEENERLRAENERLRREAVERLGVERDLLRLQTALEYERAWGREVRPVDVVHIDHASWLQSALVAVGERSAQANQAVVTGDGLLGRVVLAVGPYAKVQLVTDRAAHVGVMVERTRRQGITRGAGRDGLVLDFVPARADLAVGDRLLTAGIDGVYPRGIPVGTVRSVEPGPDLFYRVEVTPAVDLGRLDQVMLLAPAAVPEAAREAVPGTSVEDPS